MIQGAGSNVGKSLIVAGLCRAAVRRGLSVAPFKPQNMSNNAAVTIDGGEIGRAQALQAVAACRDAIVDMNPVLLKPESEVGSQIIVQGQRWKTAKAREYAELKPLLMPAVLESFNRLKATSDLVIVEGAGSPAEINLRRGDIANMGFATAADVPVVIVGDIDRGGVIAQLIGTQAVLDDADAGRIAGFIINKFRGDPSLFDDGYAFIASRTRWRGYGVVPYFAAARDLPAEDALDLESSAANGHVKIAFLGLSRIANFDDFDPLKLEPGLGVTLVRAGMAIPADTSLVIIPGTKSTRADLDFLRQQGWDIDIAAHVRRGGRVLGICGGYQMLGRTIADPEGLEGPPGTSPGLGLLDVGTVLTAHKRLERVSALHVATRHAIDGYEIHIGRTSGPDCSRPFATIGGESDGALSADARIAGTYLHGLFVNDGFRRAYLAELGVRPSKIVFSAHVDRTLDALADHLERHIDVAGLLALAK